MAVSVIAAPASGNIVVVSHDSDSQQLFIQFLYMSSVYRYDGINEDLAHGFETALSATAYLKSAILPISTGVRVA